MILVILCAARLARSIRSYWDRLDEELANLLRERGWKRQLAMQHAALAVLSEDSFLIGATSVGTFYMCTHSYEANGAMLQVGLIRPGGSDRTTGKAGTIVLATEALRTPITCMIATRTHPGLFAARSVVNLENESGIVLYVHFAGGPSASQEQLTATLRIIGCVFCKADGLFALDSRVLMGKQGLVVSGPEIRSPIDDSKAIQEFLAGSERLLDSCQTVWEINSRFLEECT